MTQTENTMATKTHSADEIETFLELAADCGWGVQRLSARENGGRARLSVARRWGPVIVEAYSIYPDDGTAWNALVLDAPAIDLNEVEL